jgi:hypothetical protein
MKVVFPSHKVFVDEVCQFWSNCFFSVDVQFALKGCSLTTYIFDVDVKGHP